MTPSVKFDEAAIDAIFASLNQCQLPGAAVGIASGGKPIYRKAFGLSNIELPVILTCSTRMRIASVTKHFTCLAYLLLCEDGRCELDDPIGKFVPEIHPVTGVVKVQQLMGNISGVRDSMDVCHRFSGLGRGVSCTELVAEYRHIDDVNAPPGTQWMYNNGGWLLLTEAIERICGQSLEQVLREKVFEPVGMHDTLLRRWDTNFVPNSASSHMVNLSGDFEKNWDGMDAAGAGAIVSTVNDMLRWLSHMETPTVGSKSTWEILKRPQTLANGTSTGYAMGIYVEQYRGIEAIHHAGNLSGSNSQMLKIPSAGLDIVVMVNRGDVHAVEFAKKIMDSCLPDLRRPKRAALSCSAVEGVFCSPSTGRTIHLFAKEGKQIASVDSLDFEVEADAEGTLWPGSVWEGLVKQSIEIAGERTKPTAIRFTYFGNADELVRVDPPATSGAASIVGLYEAKAIGAVARILDTPEGLRLSTTGRFGTVVCDLTCLADKIWHAKFTRGLVPAGGILAFDADNQTFRFSSWQSWGLRFKRSA